MIFATAALIVSTMAPGSAVTANQAADPPCDMPPPGSDQECIDCMSDACDEYQKDFAACGSNQQCKAIARADYELSLLLCTTCDPSLQAFASVIGAINPSERAWVVGELARFGTSPTESTTRDEV